MALNQFPRRSFVGSSTLQTFTGDGTTTAFTLSSAQTQNEVFLFVDDVAQVPGVDFTVSGTTLTFATAPANNAEIIARGFGVPAPVTTVSDGSVTAAKLASGAIEAKLGYTPVSPTQLSNEVAALVDSAPSALNTLNELAAALGDDANYASTITTALGTKANTSSLGTLASVSPTGTPDNTKFLRGDNSWQVVAVTPTAVSDQLNTSTGYFDLPSGTTAQRPGSPNSGMIRYNSSLNAIEAYDGSSWNSIATQGIITTSLALYLNAQNYTSGAGTWTDSIGNYSFTLSGSSTKPNAYQIAPSTGSINFRDGNPSALVFGTNAFTIECWIYLNSTSFGSWRYIFGKSNFWDAGSYGLYINENGTALGFHTTNSLGTQYALSSIGTGWKHIIATRDSNGRKLYVNGTQVNSDSTVDNITSTQNVCYGSDSNGGYGESTYRLGNARIYSIALNSSQVTQNFNAERSYYGV
jgi:hypothetical protein